MPKDNRLISISETVAKAKAAGFLFKRGKPASFLHYYSTLRLIPPAVRRQPAPGVKNTVGFYPEEVIGRLLKIQELAQKGLSLDAIREKLIAEIDIARLSSGPETVSLSYEKDFFLPPPPEVTDLVSSNMVSDSRRRLVYVAAVGFSALVVGFLSTTLLLYARTGSLRETTGSAPVSFDKVLAAETSTGSGHLELNSDLVLNGKLNVSTPIGVNGQDIIIDQNLSRTSSPTFSSLTLAAATGQLSLPGGSKITLPNASGTVVLDTATQTLTNKTIDGGSNTLQNIANSALSNSKVTVTAGTNLSGGGDVSLGSSVTLNLKSDVSLATMTTSGLATLNSATISGNLGVVGLATVSGTLSTGGNFMPLASGVQNMGSSSLVWNNIYANAVISGSGGTQGYWQRSLGGLAPTFITDDVLIGAAATSSAKIVLSGTSGNVGIGSTSPAYKVDVVGTVQITGSGFTGLRMPTGSSANYLLTSDGSGNASWTNPSGLTSFGAWTLSGSTIYPNSTSYDLLLGSTDVTKDIAKLRAIGSSGTTAVATISGTTAMAALVVDNSGIGDLFTASSSGLNRFVITQNGNVGIGTTVPNNAIQVANLINFNNGSLSTYLGYQAAAAGGSRNIFIGYQTSPLAAVSSYNTVVGTDGAASSLTSGGVNSIFGSFAGANLTSGDSNVLLGYGAGSSLTTGINNTFVGVYAGQASNNSSASENVFVGRRSGSSLTTGSYNTGLGDWAGQGVSLGQYNSFLGYSAGYDLTSGSYNVAIGQNVDLPSNTGSQQLNIGNVIYGTGIYGGAFASSTPVAGGAVGIGATTPLATLDVRKLLSGTTPVASISGKTSFAALVVDNSGTGDLFTASSSGLSRFVIAQSGNVGIGTTAPGSALNINSGVITWNTTASTAIDLGGSSGVSNSNIIIGGGLGNSYLKFGGGSYNASYLLLSGNNGVVLQRNGADVASVTYGSTLGLNAFEAINTLGVGIGNPTGTVDIRAASGLYPTATISGRTGQAALIVDNSGTGDLFTASSSGLNRFVITQNGNVGIGTTVPVSILNLVNTTSAAPRGIVDDQYSTDSIGPRLELRKARGSVTSPTVIQNNDVLANIAMSGYDGSSFGSSAFILGVATEIWSTTAHGSAIQIWTTPTGSITSAQRLVVDSAGNVGIGVTGPTHQLQLSTDDAAKTTTTTWTTTSDIRTKTNVAPFIDGLSIIDQINPVTFTYNGLGGTVAGINGMGVIAQEVKLVAPYLIGSYKAKLHPDDLEETDILSFNPHGLFLVTINALKELDLRTGTQSAEIASQSARLDQNTFDIATMSAALSPDISASLSAIPQIRTELDLVKEEMASVSGRLAKVESRTASNSAAIKEDFFSKEVFFSKNIDISSFSAELATISGNLTVLGKTQLAQTSIGGPLTVGLLTVNDVKADLTSLTGSLSLQGGTATIDSQGNVKISGSLQAHDITSDTATIRTATINKLNVTESVASGSAVLGASVGEATIPAGQTKIEIKTATVTAGSRIFVTVQGVTDIPLGVSTKSPGASFAVEMAKPQPKDIVFDWWVVN